MTEPYKIIEVKESVFADNDREAAEKAVADEIGRASCSERV